MEKEVCNQCKNCAVENTAVLGCADDNCKCHTKYPKPNVCLQCGKVGHSTCNRD